MFTVTFVAIKGYNIPAEGAGVTIKNDQQHHIIGNLLICPLW